MKPFEVFCTEKAQSFKKPKPRKDTQNKSLPSSSFPSARPAGCSPAAAAWGRYTPPSCRRPSYWRQRFGGCDGGRRRDAAGGVCWVPGGRPPPYRRGAKLERKKDKRTGRRHSFGAHFFQFKVSSFFQTEDRQKKEKWFVFSLQMEHIGNVLLNSTQNTHLCTQQVTLLTS